MKSIATADILKDVCIDDATIHITFFNQDGTKGAATLRSPEDFVNEIVPEGSSVNLVYMNHKIYSGLYQYVLDEDGQLVIYIRSTGGARFLYGLPYDKLVGYFKDSDE